MKSKPVLLDRRWCPLALVVLFTASAPSQTPQTSSIATQPSPPIPMDQLGAVAGKQYQGDGLSVVATPDGAQLRCAFQRLAGEVTSEGLWLSSTADSASGKRFRVMAMEVGRDLECAVGSGCCSAAWQSAVSRIGHPQPSPGWSVQPTASRQHSRLPTCATAERPVAMPAMGRVETSDNVTRFIRPDLTEEYSVSVDGVRQDFIIQQRPAGEGELRLELDVTGATVEPLGNGARLTLPGSGRKLAYNRLHVTDATGRELPARMEVASGNLPAVEGAHPAARSLAANHSSAILPVTSESAGLEAPALRQARMPAATKLAVLVDDANAVYPVRIDPTFSDADWFSLGGFPGAGSTVYAAVTDSLGNLYIGGVFTNVGSVTANRIAKWDGVEWSSLGLGINGEVLALATDGTNVYAGGFFNTAGGTGARSIAKWNGTTWSFLSLGINGFVYSLAVQGTNLYAGGYFSQAGFVPANGIAKWNGITWSGLGAGMTNGVRALAVLEGDVFAGGDFTFAGGVAANRVAKWNGNAWSALGAGLNNRVFALAGAGTNLIAGGEFSVIAKWDGNAWTNLGTAPVSSVYALAVSGTKIFAGGRTWYSYQNICEWNGTNWAVLGSGVESYKNIYALSLSGQKLFAGGDFLTAGEVPANRIAAWDGAAWQAVGAGINGHVSALAVIGGDLYAGGTFTTAGSVSANRIAKWNGNTWSALGAGVNGTVNALAVMHSDLYVGGNFTTAGGSFARGVTKWNGAAWKTLGLGLDSYVNALTVSGTNLFVAGIFTFATNAGLSVINTKRIAKWDGNEWSALGSGMDHHVYALAVLGTNLYAGGAFSTAGGLTAKSIAKWDGAAWSALATGMGGNLSPYVYVLAGFGPALYAGGSFTTAGGATAFRIAVWNGNAWSAVGTGMNNTVNALVMSGTDLYAGGYFTMAGGTSARGIAKWNGSAWAALGSGIGGLPTSNVKALLVDSTDLYVGGEFITAGNKVSAYVAKGHIGAPRRFGQFTGLSYSPATGFSCTFSGGLVGFSYRIQSSPSLAGPWTDFTNFVYNGPVVISDPSALSGTNKFFRAVTP